MPIVGLTETDLPRRSGIRQVVDVLTPDRCLWRSQISPRSGLTAAFSGHPVGGAEDAKNQRLRLSREICDMLTRTAQGGQYPWGRGMGRRGITWQQEGQSGAGLGAGSSSTWSVV